jgi:triosephosphate isomerase
MRPRIVAGNWKMNTTRETARQLAAAVVAGLGGDDRVRVILCPPFPYLGVVKEAIAGSRVALGGQNCHSETSGAYTGEVSPVMLRDVGCEYVILGHSERRHGLGESDGFINFKVHAALEAGLHVILCVGETLDERRANRVQRVFDRQVAAAFAGLGDEPLSRLIIAYEPVWAIGTGQNATPEQVQTAHAHIRGEIARRHGEKLAADLPILYGGSVKADNARALFSQPDVDGGLIGGASLKSQDFLAIVQAAVR